MGEQTIILCGAVQREAAHKRIDGLPLDGSMEMAIRPSRKTRSLPQNALFWGARLRDISQQAWVQGRQFSEDAWHEYLKSEYMPEGDEENIAELVRYPDKYKKWEWLPDGSRWCCGSTTSLTKKGMTQYMTQCESYAATELGVMFSADRMAA